MLIWITSLICFLCLVRPDLGQGPSAVIGSVLATGGTPNPSGYPLLTLLSQVALAFPGPSPILKLGFLNAVIASGVVYFVWKISTLLLKPETHKWRSVLLGLMSVSVCIQFAGFTRNVLWFDRYMLLLLSYLGLLSVCLFEFPKLSLRARPFVLGLGFSLCLLAHLSLAPIALLLCMYAWFRIPMAYWRKLFISIFGAFLGATPYLILPVISKTNPFFDWGNPETLQNLLRLIRRDEYGPLHRTQTIDQLGEAWSTMTNILIQEIGWYTVLMAIGFFVFLKGRSLIEGFLVSCIVFFATAFVAVTTYFQLIPGAHLYQTYIFWIQKNYYLFGCVFFALFVPLGMQSALQFFEKKIGNKLPNSPSVKMFTGVCLALFFGASAYLALSSLYRWRSSPSPSRLITDLMADTIPENSLLFTSLDSLYFTLEHAKLNEGKLKSNVLVHQSLFGRSWYVESLQTRYPNHPVLKSQEVQDYILKIKDYEHNPSNQLGTSVMSHYYQALRKIAQSFDERHEPIVLYDAQEVGFPPVNFLNDYAQVTRLPVKQTSKNSMEMNLGSKQMDHIEEFVAQLETADLSKTTFWHFAYASQLLKDMEDSVQLTSALDVPLGENTRELIGRIKVALEKEAAR